MYSWLAGSELPLASLSAECGHIHSISRPRFSDSGDSTPNNRYSDRLSMLGESSN